MHENTKKMTAIYDVLIDENSKSEKPLGSWEISPLVKKSIAVFVNKLIRRIRVEKHYLSKKYSLKKYCK